MKLFNIITTALTFTTIASSVHAEDSQEIRSVFDDIQATESSKRVGQLYLHFQKDSQDVAINSANMVGVSSFPVGGGVAISHLIFAPRYRYKIAGIGAGLGMMSFGQKLIEESSLARQQRHVDKVSTFRDSRAFEVLNNDNEIGLALTEEMMSDAFAGMEMAEFVKKYIQQKDRWIIEKSLQSAMEKTSHGLITKTQARTNTLEVIRNRDAGYGKTTPDARPTLPAKDKAESDSINLQK